MIDEEESNPISILLTVMVAVIVMSFVLLIMGTFLDLNLGVFETVIEPELGTWGAGLYADLVTEPAQFMFLVPGFFIIVFLVWGIKSVIKKQTYGKRDDEFLDGNL